MKLYRLALIGIFSCLAMSSLVFADSTSFHHGEEIAAYDPNFGYQLRQPEFELVGTRFIEVTDPKELLHGLRHTYTSGNSSYADGSIREGVCPNPTDELHIGFGGGALYVEQHTRLVKVGDISVFVAEEEQTLPVPITFHRENAGLHKWVFTVRADSVRFGQLRDQSQDAPKYTLKYHYELYCKPTVLITDNYDHVPN